MKILPRTQFGNPILRKKAEPVDLATINTPAFRELIKNMFFTIEEIGVGLAAPQIGTSIQLAVINIHPLPHRPTVQPFRRVIINPEITKYSQEQVSEYEGCLSFDELRAEASRSTWVEVTYFNENGEKCSERAEGFVAKVFQHEIDHLNGVLFVDRMKDTRTIMTTAEFNKRF